MPCQRVACNLKSLSSIQASVDMLLPLAENGSVWIAPTDTIYGIMGTGLSPAVAEKILKIKSRNKKQFLMIIRDLDVAKEYAYWDDIILQNYIQYFKTGMMTLVLKSRVPAIGETIALRIASDPISKCLMEKINYPLLSTSANVSGEPYADDPAAIYARFSGAVDIMIDAGPLGNAVPSTVIDMTGQKPQVLREGQFFERIKNAIT